MPVAAPCADPADNDSTPRSPVVCDVCGGATFEARCKVICRRCGHTRDCADP